MLACKSRMMAHLAFFFIAVLLGCDAGRTVQEGGNYPPVSSEQLAGKTSSQRTGADNFDFKWSFQEKTFAIEGPEIPTDLTNSMLGKNTSVSRIQGTWVINGRSILFTVETDTAETGSRNCSLPIYCTGPIRIETPEAQYVF